MLTRTLYQTFKPLSSTERLIYVPYSPSECPSPVITWAGVHSPSQLDHQSQNITHRYLPWVSLFQIPCVLSSRMLWWMPLTSLTVSKTASSKHQYHPDSAQASQAHSFPASSGSIGIRAEANHQLRQTRSWEHFWKGTSAWFNALDDPSGPSRMGTMKAKWPGQDSMN